MGTYCTTTSLDTLTVGTTFDTATGALASLCVDWAENEINKYLSKRYDITAFNTTTAIPPLVRSLCEQLGVGYLYQNNARGGKESRERGKEYINMAIDNLKLLSSYELDLLNTAGSVIVDFSDTAYRVLSSTDTYTDTFDEGDPLNWVIDSDKLDAIKSSKD